ncbi:hypothetical protein CEXT_9191 [Caerostris extrusa]|uniref:Uncharacterized protein n=1 Tax=Caerostris extrusa TaxID=172846 RepID=A0AAV4PU21_CAEEX|nr:hypothetical protein CEXT_9191 [Caerostris extrusa]
MKQNGEIGGNDVNMTESSPLSSENSLPETTSDLLSLKPIRPASSSSYIVTDDFIFENKQIMDHINNMRHQLKIIKAVTERREQTSNNIAQPATAAKNAGTKPKQPTKRKSSPDTQLDNSRARRSTDKEGFSAPPRHFISRGTHYMSTPPDSNLDSTTNSFSSLTNMTNSEMADDADPPEQPPRRQGPPPFIKCTKDWGSILPQLKTISPTLSSVVSRGNFLKITVASEVEHVRMKNKLVHLGLEFKCFNLKQDRPVKVMIRITSLYQHRGYQFLHYHTSDSKFLQLINSLRDSAIYMQSFKQFYYADIIAGRTNHQAPPIIRPQAPPTTGAKNALLSEFALDHHQARLLGREFDSTGG